MVESREHGGLMGDITDLVTLSYQNTPETNDEPLRDMLTQYTAAEFKALMSQEKFRTFWAQGRQFVHDVSVKLGRSL